MRDHRVTEEEVEQSLNFLRDKAYEIGPLLGRCKGLEHVRKTVHGEQALLAEAKTVAEKEYKAYSSTEFKQVVEDIENAWADWKTMDALMYAADQKIQVWRSQNKAGNAGHL